MTLILFDVDGTLTATNAVDAQCYAAAFLRTFGFPLPTTDWDVYRFCTDTGIIQEVVENRLGRSARRTEIDAFERAFVDELEKVFAKEPAGFREVPGAKAVLEAIGAHNGLRAGIASGGMRGSATYKLSRIGVDVGAWPSAFANDSITREGIAACAAHRCAPNDTRPDIVYVGDGPWDCRTSAAAGMRFIGISGNASADRLAVVGAETILDNYLDQDAFFEAVKTAKVPKTTG